MSSGGAGMSEKSTFSWDAVYARRRKIAAEVQRRLGLSFLLGVEEPFSALDLTDQNLADQPMWRVPFYVIAQRLIADAECHVIDHAWWLLTQDRWSEPWGFVTEPYIGPKKAQRLAEALQQRHEGWGIEVRVLPKAQSAWLPDGTVPIVTTVTVGCLPEFLRFGVGAALESL
jgi:hypothetical protein